ncbi:MarR family transcriptional regulator [Paracoccus sp. 1_MG-2023]|uniref:MarR family winged helix-turn-helix transcriptional regulator n=1 Tax=unclassified Paracoccus (in: a-proteobacteria) TaxID=2688777 RepID=UPI001C089FE6|nr:MULTISPECIES: MarR family transcriptional regulator [unclassified Paracoccus (in: a-proteobacteria)]MBU2956653.1 MarR family transcriptional regulator [Paracoccus sp. C2R09]MDO6668759.1 MarR family transcriptional regulator [Paracoccus sp. 1_MG-2023]
MADTSIIDSLLTVMRDMRRHFDEAARGMGLTMSRAKIITTLHREQGMTQTALAAQLGIETPTLKRQLDALAADGFIERRPIEGDARKNAVFLTDKGQRSSIVAFSLALREDVVAGIPEGDLDTARQVLDAIAANIARRSS